MLTKQNSIDEFPSNDYNFPCSPIIIYYVFKPCILYLQIMQDVVPKFGQYSVKRRRVGKVEFNSRN